MDVTMDDHNGDSSPQSVENAWQYSQGLWSAGSGSEAWTSFKSAISALPGWALVVLIVGLVGLLANSSVIVYPLAVGAFLAATYFTVKRAILSALREYDSESRP